MELGKIQILVMTSTGSRKAGKRRDEVEHKRLEIVATMYLLSTKSRLLHARY